jgi:hypothetical protein
MKLTSLQSTIDDVIARLVALRQSAVVSEPIFDDDPTQLLPLRQFAITAARAIDPLFHEVAYLAGLAHVSCDLETSEHARIVSEAVNGDLEWEIQKRAESMAAERAHYRFADPDDEHRLGAAQLGVGRHA